MTKARTSLRSVLTAAVFILIIGGFFILNRAVATPETLVSERRKPAAFPELTVKTLLNAEFMGGFDDYAADSFAFRDALRTVRAFSVFDIFMQTDKSGLYRDADVGAGKFGAVPEDAIRRTAAKIGAVAATLDGLNVYVSVVPDKSGWAARDYPGFDPDAARAILGEELPGLTYIDVSEALDGGSFYKTDLHWDQEKIVDVATLLGRAMGSQPETQYTANTVGEFSGVYPGQLALPMAQDTARYLTSDATSGAAVKYLDDKTLKWVDGEMYDLEAFSGRDPYDLFLRGAQAMITIENPSATGGRELYLFRDSFGSSLAPLLVSAYSKITLIDLRYVDARALPMLVEFKPGSDALFMYSSQILGAPEILLAG
ncbi:MAG: hypothetical protein LBN99_08360 [Oscillospiraceae bacterium]|jgi:hypothetical protein|nr:hypothetical protein [Oscillospiraceae bacterium]